MPCRLFKDARAVTSVEYALIALLVLVAIVASLHTYGDAMAGMYARISDKVVPALGG